jgi:hypothetical protein
MMTVMDEAAGPVPAGLHPPDRQPRGLFMKSIIAATVTVAAALSLGACSPSQPTEANLADNALTLNEADFPAEGNFAEPEANSTLGFDNTLGNADAGLGNDGLANEGALLNGN